MEKLILELTHQGKSSYHSLTKFPVTIGRAYDCDIVVPEITVSPKHLRIDATEQGLELISVGGENGTQLNKKVISEHTSLAITLPSTLKMGELNARLLDPSMQVAPTQLTRKGGFWPSLLSNPFWAVFFVALNSFIIVGSKYIRTPVQQEELIYFNALLLPLLGMFVVAFIISVVSRLTKHRWAFIPALSIAGLLFLLPLLFDHFGHFLSYLTSSDLAATLLKYLTNFLLLPLLLTLYLKKVHYIKGLQAIGVALIVTMPVSAFFASDLVQEMSNNSGFSPMPSYNKTLSAFDLRLQNTLEVDEFLMQSDAILEQAVEQLSEDESN